ncbi:MAG: DUF1015 domain-containing protein [Oscillospiraceae bacterium]|nr:DUF1015 domain-containing protein [Oscillospiraceae bacterium]
MKNIKEKLAKVGAGLPKILFPAEGVDLTRFAAVACDQYSAQPEYWQDVKTFVGGAPSALELMMPEAWLQINTDHQEKINKNMERYLENGTLRELGEGMVFLHRTTTTGDRRGLVLTLDLEEYDFTPGSSSLIRATEKTVVERLPTRIEIRKNAPIEMPHIMVLIDDRENTLMGRLDKAVTERKPLYDFPLMQGSGALKGWFINDAKTLDTVADALAELKNKAAGGMLYAMGDGNHSFAAAKAHWDTLKGTLPEGIRKNHPARWGMVELVNLYDPALSFEPIHRLIMNVDPKALQDELGFDAKNPPSLQDLQPKLDEWLLSHPEAEIEYIHGREDCLELAKADDRLAIVWDEFKKDTLFSDVEKHGVLCRKTFSMGSAPDKRFYLECRKIKL